MTASLRIKNDRYYVVVSVKEDGKYKQKWHSLDLPAKNNKRKAELMFEQMKKDGTLFIDKNEMMFVDFLLNWIEEKEKTLSPVTYCSYKATINSRIVPYFQKANLKTSEVKPIHIKAFLEDEAGKSKRSEKGLSYGTIVVLRSVLKSAFNDAVLKNYVSLNPVTPVRAPKSKLVTLKKENFLTADQARQLLLLLENHKLQVPVYLTLCYGLRISEVLGLKWSCIDFANNTIEIKHTIIEPRRSSAGAYGVDKTKTGMSHRVFPLLPEAKKLLIRLKERKEDFAKRHKIEFNENDYVFSRAKGGPWSPSNTSACFRHFIEDNDFKPAITFHGLRHSTASILHENNWDIKDAQYWLRHSNVSTTANIYTHVSENREEELAKTISKNISLIKNTNAEQNE